jgi:cytochrome c oxidase subunit 2
LEALIDTREEYDDLLALYLPIGIAVAAIVFGLVFFAVIRYRRRDDELPAQREGMPLIEGLYAVLLAGIVALLLSATFSTEDEVDAVPDAPGLDIDVTAFQWGWRFDYPHGVSVVGDDVKPPTLTVPTDTAVRFTLESRDVIHSFWIPELRFKRDAFPERDNTFDLVFSGDETLGRCAEFCGLAHGEMTFGVNALPPAEFDDWLATQRRAERGGGG